MATFELKLRGGKVVEWDGDDGVDASRRYVDSHRDAAVIAWRKVTTNILVIGWPRHGSEFHGKKEYRW